ncbi:RagB/SusD family nutrient uptake outer membrane protein [Rhodohalobacter sp. SW132]|uniref:RagB/SusD family nutrient uptake outer membrane protein n=2 Tax=Rhodohalobacter sp. SW132 TaxID=2293433 RepID=UPI001ADFA8DF|nr:RagB/SusD family nutrient uptake outer membrane protein [Rhodohalobacter sp. SW132]
MKDTMNYTRTKAMKLMVSGLLVLCVVIGTSGCSDGLLTTVPTDRVSSGTFWANERDFNTALNGTYERMVGVNGNLPFFDGTTEIGYSHADWVRQHGTVMGRSDGQSGWPAGFWARNYNGITRANEVLSQLETVEDGVLSAEASNHIRGQALFLRGYFYHQLLWMFGEVPIFTSVPTVEEASQISRNSRDEVYARITDDLSEAANLLPPSWPSSQYGRATSGVAMGYHARTALYEASWKKYHEGNDARANELFNTAVNMAQAVINLNEYSLHPDFRELFTYAGEQSNEIIFDYQRVSGQNGWSAWRAFAPSSMGSNVDIAPTRELVDRFPMEDGLPIDESPLYDPEAPRITYDGSGNPTVETIGKYANRDPRFYGTVLYPGAEFNGVIYNSYPACGDGAPAGYCSPTSDRILISDYNNTYTGYIAMKYLDPQDEASPTNSGLNHIKMRYADILLMYAEAKVELGEQDASVNEAIQEIRDRLNIPLPYDLTTMSQEDAIDFIRNERTIEFAWEGLHLADIRRWGTAEIVLNGETHGIDVNRGGNQFEPIPGQHVRSFSSPRDYLWPIPTSERDLNPNLVQNPGY